MCVQFFRKLNDVRVPENTDERLEENLVMRVQLLFGKAVPFAQESTELQKCD